MEHVFPIALATIALAFALVSRRLSTSVVTPPMVFVGGGLLLAAAGVSVDVDLEAVMKVLAEGTLVLLLFSDAARIDLVKLKREFAIPGRMLAAGMPLAIALGTVLAHFCFPTFSWWECALLSTLLAPTDAALSQPVLASTAVPVVVRQTINVESGLNDGIAVPFVTLTVACAAIGATETNFSWNSPLLGELAGQIAFGPIVGVAVGGAGAWLFGRVRRGDGMAHSWKNIGGIALAALSFLIAEAIGGSGFIGAFVAGLVFGTWAADECAPLAEFVENEGTLLMLIAFFIFGFAFVPGALLFVTDHFAVVVFGALSLTLVRMLPVALALVGRGFHPVSLAVLGWLGPRGLATLVFALGVQQNARIPHHQELFSIAMAVVFASIFLHGVTAAPLASAYARFCDRLDDTAPEHGAHFSHPIRFLGGRSKERATADNAQKPH